MKNFRMLFTAFVAAVVSTSAFAASSAPKCFSKSYSEKHLVDHPKQNVTAMAAKYETKMIDNEMSFQSLKIQATVRGDSRLAVVELGCADGRCFIDCDGPRVGIAFAGDQLIINNKKSEDNYLTLDFVGCGDEFDQNGNEIPVDQLPKSIHLDGSKGADDVFVLDAMPAHQCL